MLRFCLAARLVRAGLGAQGSSVAWHGTPWHWLRATLKTFNSVCKKLQIAGKREAELTSEEQDVVAPFELSSAANVPAATTQQRARTRTRAHRRTEDFATALLRSNDIPSEAGPRYSPLVRAILPTSTRCDILFSQCKLVMTPQRSSLLPINLEMIEFLRAIRKYCNAHTLMGIEVADADD
ncbi:hypothetical protein PR003_g3751 [Phytophthora rubi]|uniref:HAT C-terminal dimerisation domain-containing protein n=1 Tax=Phytophthora rubi TaxID=129364 RepID=A0A6A4FP91_9STRA|nr:hypothetical protein PR003_g3751 [Phytophthora rubi]